MFYSYKMRGEKNDNRTEDKEYKGRKRHKAL